MTSLDIVSCAEVESLKTPNSREGFDLERVNTALNAHVNIFNLYGSFSS